MMSRSVHGEHKGEHRIDTVSDQEAEGRWARAKVDGLFGNRVEPRVHQLAEWAE